MGQSPSRNREPEAPSLRNPNGNGRESSSSSLPSTRRRPSSKRRSTVRRSIVNLVTPASRHGDSTSENPNGKRKSWFKSRRWSKAPPAEQVAEPELEENAVGQSETATGGTMLPVITPKETETVAAATTPAAATSLAAPLEAQQEQQQHQQDTFNSTHEPPQLPDSIAPDPGDPPSISQNRETLDTSSFSTVATQPETSHIQPELVPLENATSSIPSQNVGHENVSLSASPDESETARDTTRTEENVTPSEESTSDPPNSTQSEVPPTASPTPNAIANTNSNPNPPPQSRPFPPPGTLVVVQGVVHTTDVPRPVPTSSSPSSPLSNSIPSPTESHGRSQTPIQASQPHSRLSDSGLGSRIRRSVSNASRPRSETGSSARNRLSAFFSGSRPTSVVGGGPPSSASNTALDEASSSTESRASSSSPADATTFRRSSAASPSDSDPSVDVNSPSASSSATGSGSSGRADSESDATTVISQSPEGVSGSNEEQNQTPRPTRSRSLPPVSPQSGVISSSSIDVLGTLLSVAAAATAASLLTGSSDPVLPTAMGPSPDSPRTGSPGPVADPFAAGLDGLDGLGTESNVGGVGANGRTDRVRQAWGSIRDRLGLRPQSGSLSGNDVPVGESVPTAGVGVGAGAGRDENVPLLSDIDGRRSEAESPTQSRSEPPRAARDRMLAEMARAFQLGLGLTGPQLGGGENNSNGVGSRQEAGVGGGNADPVGFGIGRTRVGELPPEGSFERFLVDLQTDLRTALGGGNQQQQQQHQPQQRPQEQEQEPADDDATVTPRPAERENDIDELFRLIAEAEAEVRQRQRVIAERQATLRALMSGATAALESATTANAQPPASPSGFNQRARVESVPDSDEESSASLPMLEDISDDSDSEDEAPPPVRPSAPVASNSENSETERPEVPSMSRLSSMFDRPPPSNSRGVNSISETLSRRRAMGIGRTPPISAAELSRNSVLPPLREVPSSRALPMLALDIPPAPEPTPVSSPSTRAETEASPVPNATSSAHTNPGTDATGTTTESGPSQTPTSEPSNNTTRSQAGSRNPIDDGTGRINWWRLYRFPPIAAPPPRATAQGLGQTRGTNSATPINVPTSVNPPVSPLQDSPSLQPNMGSVAEPLNSSPEITPTSPTAPQQSPSGPQDQNEPQPPQQAASNTVVPVIVVGLQSVNLAFLGPGAGAQQQPNRAPPAPALAANNTTTANAPSPISPTENEEELLAGAGGEQDDTNPRETRQRRWQSRAAEALRTLRHGRNSPQRPPNGLLPDMLDAPGSRTFLIYVIGGYYPPDHNIVTGDPDTLDSFEALLDLADLLGQVKSPTASKEDIERSGLEVIKAPQVSLFEQEGKISSNCTERCLICLDDYETEDDVRVLTCKHAFHMNCVDKWLQEGKNNCPACRGAGVATASAS